MKKIFCVFLLALTMASVFAGCGLLGGDDSKDTGSKSETEVKTDKNDGTEEPKADKPDNAGVADKSDDSDKPDDEGEAEKPASEAREYVVVLDPGHGGGFSGAVSGSLVEKEISLKIGLTIKEYMEDNYPSIKVFMTRDTDTALSGDVVVDLEQRCEYAKSVGADILVSLHLNASEEHKTTGANMYISHRENVTEQSKKLGNCILSQLSALGIENCGTHTRNSNDLFDENGKVLDYYAINRHCAARDIPGIIVEHCFIDAKSDQSFIDSDEDIRKLAEADAEGIVAYFYGE